MELRFDLTVTQVDVEHWRWAVYIVRPGTNVEHAVYHDSGNETSPEAAWEAGRRSANEIAEAIRLRRLWRSEARTETIAVVDE